MFVRIKLALSMTNVQFCAQPLHIVLEYITFLVALLYNEFHKNL
jgi:hypothetical protein